ncbi:uncharacterized protein LOC143279726 [Babylonia areolata]|uniref:uncharacterized protein LOC143279726 n=1 Tax=Babylonia areolata TaxID=304850 RepID=UPI003FD213D4
MNAVSPAKQYLVISDYFGIMADFEAGQTFTNGAVDSRTHSRENSLSSDGWRGEEEQNKENTQTNALTRRDSGCSDDSGKLILRDGGQLKEESRTEVVSGIINPGFKSIHSQNGDSNGSTQIPEIPSRQPSTGGGTGTARHKVLKSGNMVSFVPEEEITLPTDGNLASFSADSMATFLRYLRLEDRLINHLHRNGLDGRKFGRLKDSDLDTLKLNNPVVVYFRDRTAPAVTKKAKPRLPFVL